MATIESLMRRTVRVGECLEYTGHICKAGYGLVWHDGKNRLAHRVSFELHNMPIMGQQDVMHSCDNRKCINPSHLSLGSRLDNMRDMISKGRAKHPKGKQPANTKATPEIVAEIRRRFSPYSRTDGHRALGRQFGLTQGTVWAIVNGRTWKE